MIHVLIADDEMRVCRLIENLVDWRALDMEVVGIAHNGIEALEQMKQKAPDLVITDIRMPGCDGLELIHRAKQINPDIAFIIISGYRHFEYAQSAIKYGVCDYLLKPIKKEELLSTLEKMRKNYLIRTERISETEQMQMRLENNNNRLRGSFFTDCILGDKKTPDDLVLLRSEYHLHFQPGIFSVLIVKIDRESGIPSTQELEVLRAKAEAILQDVTEKCFDSACFLNGSRIYIVINYRPERKDEINKSLHAAMERLLAQKPAFPNTLFTIAAGSEHTSPALLRQSAEKADLALGERLTTFAGRVIRYEPAMEKHRHDDWILAELNRAMTAAVEVLDSEKLKRAVGRFDADLEREGVCGAELFSFVIEGYSRYLVLLQNQQMMHADVPRLMEKFRAGADLCATDKQLLSYFADKAAARILDLTESRENEEARPIRQAKEYILAQYMSPLTLEEVSGVVGFNPSYFSTFFKKKCGIGFLEYLSEVRVNKAKELLRTTDFSVAEICEKVGYTDTRHFTSIFKKSTGIKPTEFRKLYT